MREKDGYRDALERIRSYGYGEMLTVSQVAEIVYRSQPTPQTANKRVTRTFTGWIGKGRGKTIPATALARQIC